MDLAVGGNLVCFLIIVDIFIVLGRAVDWGGDFKVIIWGESHKGMYGESSLLKTPCKEFNVAIGGGLGWMKWLKNGAEKVYTSWNYSSIISFLVKTLLVKLKYL